jgi:hypothetical protein
VDPRFLGANSLDQRGVGPIDQSIGKPLRAAVRIGLHQRNNSFWHGDKEALRETNGRRFLHEHRK